jgi:hypothetical protein
MGQVVTVVLDGWTGGAWRSEHVHHLRSKSPSSAKEWPGNLFQQEKKNVQELEPRVRNKVLLLQRMLLTAGSGKPINLRNAFTAMTLGKILLIL